MRKVLVTILTAVLCIAFASFSFAALSPAFTDDPIPGIMGDANGDGGIGAADAAAVLRILAGLSVADEVTKVLGDVNHDNQLTAADAAQILRYLAGLSSSVESVIEKRVGDLSFIAEDNEATLTIYHSDCPVVFVPRAMEGHRVTALAADLFAGVDIEIIVFFDGPPEGIGGAGLGDAEILVPAEFMEDWDPIAVSELVDIPVYFTVSAPDTVYNGVAQPIVVTPSIDVAYAVSYERNSSPEASPINAGAYTYTITITEPGYVAVGNIAGGFNMDRATIDMSGVSFVDKEVKVAEKPDNQPVPIFITITGALPEGVIGESYWYKFDPKIPGADWEPFLGEKRGGKHLVKAVFTVDTENYYPVADMFATLTLDDGYSEWNGKGNQNS
ncbi:MAG: dockerin type I domain-containing protein [Clostridiales bacterium]|nr:dockerin type I domain-containing protein [Clostridiales bacterium]